MSPENAIVTLGGAGTVLVVATAVVVAWSSEVVVSGDTVGSDDVDRFVDELPHDAITSDTSAIIGTTSMRKRFII